MSIEAKNSDINELITKSGISFKTSRYVPTPHHQNKQIESSNMHTNTHIIQLSGFIPVK